MEQPLISVVIPVYNVQDFLCECLESVINQTYRNLEIIVVDDGSTDKSGKICDEYAKRDCRIKVIHKENGGLSDARNAGLEVCTGEYIGFVDSDDTIEDDMYDLLYHNIYQYNADISACKNYIVYEDKKCPVVQNDGTIKSLTDKTSIIKELFLGKGLTVSVCVKLFKKEIFSDVRFEKGKFYEDVWVFWPVFEKCNKLVMDYSCKYNYFQRKGSICHQKKYSDKLLQRDAAYEYILQNAIKYGDAILNVVMYRVFWSYRESIYHIMLTDDWYEHIDELSEIKRNIRKNMHLLVTNEYMNVKQKFATIIAGYNEQIFLWLKLRNMR